MSADRIESPEKAHEFEYSIARGGQDIVSPIIEDQRENDDTMMADSAVKKSQYSLREKVFRR